MTHIKFDYSKLLGQFVEQEEIDFMQPQVNAADAVSYTHLLLPEHPNMSLATVYNNMKVLVKEGFVAELKVTNDPITYYDFMGHQHINIVCKYCGDIADFMDVDAIDIGKEAYEQTGYMITKVQLTAYGI